MTAAFLQEQFRTRLKELPGTDAMRAARKKAMSTFSSEGYPTRKWEDWRYTDLGPIASVEYDPIPAVPSENAISGARQLIAGLGLPDESSSIVFVDGHRCDDLGRPPTLTGLDIVEFDDAGKRVLLPQEETANSGRPLAALNTAFTAGGICVQVAADSAVDTPLHLIFAASGQPSIAQQPRVAIKLGSGARLAVVQHFIGAGPSASWTNAVTRITQEKQSTLRLYRLQDYANMQMHTELLTGQLAADSTLELGYVDLGGALVRNDIQIDLAAPGAHCNLFGLFVANEGQHIDNHIRIDHSAPRTVSQEAFKSIIGDRGRGVFNGKVVVHKNAQKIDAQQSSDNLLLSERGEIDTKPELEIYADDVKCTHGATVGQLDEEQLFYLRARGIDDMTARGLLTFAFANEILRRLRMPELRERVTHKVLERLPGDQQWDELL